MCTVAGVKTAEELLADARSRIERLTPAQALDATKEGAIIVDVRCQEDRRAEGTVPGSIHVPRTVLEWRADPSGDHRDERIADFAAHLIIMCNDGYSSSLAAATLETMGFISIADMISGYRGWVEAGCPIEL